MTVAERIKMENAIIEESGKGITDEEWLKKKIDLLEIIISDPKKYVEFESLPNYTRYIKLIDVAREINAADTREVEEWKIPIEKKIEAFQKELDKDLEDTAPAQFEEKLEKKKRDLYIGIIGREKAEQIRKQGKTLNSENEELRKAAKSVNGTAVEVIDNWKLSEEQENYVFVQNTLSKLLNDKNPDVTEDDIKRLQTIKEDLKGNDSKISESKIRENMKRLLGSSTINLFFEVIKRKEEQIINELKDNKSTQQKELGE